MRPCELVFVSGHTILLHGSEKDRVIRLIREYHRDGGERMVEVHGNHNDTVWVDLALIEQVR